MKTKLLSAAAVLCVIVVSGCSNRPSYRVSGTWEGGDGRYVYIRQEQAVLDSALTVGGRFDMNGPLEGAVEAVFAAGETSMPFLLSQEPVEVTCREIEREYGGESVTRLRIDIAGGPEQDIYGCFLNAQRDEMMIMLGLALMGRSGEASQAMMDSTANLYLAAKERSQVIFDSLVAANPDMMASAVIVNSQSRSWGAAKTEQAYNSLSERVRQSEQGRSIAKTLGVMRSLSPGSPAPDFAVAAKEGGEVSLSDFRGRYLLLDFWASWCGPCLKEAPNIRRAYDDYHDRGLEILGISLDEDAEAWLRAIESHELGWRHGSSLRGWGCPVAEAYNVTGIPAMFLVGPDGDIIASGLRGDSLQKKLSEIFAGV